MSQSETITLLFTDVVGSTEHLQRAGDEASEQLFRNHHRQMTEAIEASGGRELQWLGDGLLAAFQSGADAVRCAISMQQTACAPVAGARFEMRIGLHLGEVLRRDGGYFGATVVTARRLCDAAESGQILCSRLVADLLSSRQSFGFRDKGDMKMKGLAAPIGVCEVIYERNDPVAMLNHTPFVGRAAQLKRLSDRLGQALNGRGTVTMLRGEAGIGKSRTLEEFADLVTQRGALVLRGACYDGEWQPPYGPFAEIVAAYARDASQAELSEVAGRGAGILARIAPVLLEKLKGIAEPIALDKEEERFRLFDSVAQFIIRLSARAPLVVMLDDLHWADRGTVAMLSLVANAVALNSIMLIGAYRDGEVDRSHPLTPALAAISRLRNSETLSLTGLHVDELSSMLDLISRQAPRELVEALLSATEGNPLFIKELLRHLVEEGAILRSGQGWGSKIRIDELKIPEGVRQVVGTRLRKLSEAANLLLVVGSAFNGSFSFEIARLAADQDEQIALSAIDEALDAHLIRPAGADESFDFTHALIRQTLYSELNPARRRRLHRRIALEMERTWGDRASLHAAEVAFQFWRGASAPGNEKRGADYAIAAADNAESAYAHDDSAEFLRIALQLLPPDDTRRVSLLKRLGSALASLSQDDEATQVAIEVQALIASAEGSNAAADYCESAARELLQGGAMAGACALAAEGLRHIGTRRDLTWASLDEIESYGSAASDASNPGVMMDSERERARRAVLKAIPSAQIQARRIDNYPYESREEIVRDPDADGIALVFMAGECRRGLTMWQERAAELERNGRISLAMDSWAFTARCHNALGELVAARAAYDRAVAMSSRINRVSLPLLNLMSLRFDFLIATDDGYDEFAELPGERELFNNPPIQVRWAFVSGAAAHAMILAQQNLADPAVQLLGIVEQGLNVGASWGLNYAMTANDAAAAIWFLDRREHIGVIENSLRNKVLVHDFRFPMRDTRLSLARLCALQNRYQEAADWFQKAREVLEEAGWKPLRAITDYDEALMHLRSGVDSQKGEPLLQSAIEQFASLEMKGWLKRAQRAQRAL